MIQTFGYTPFNELVSRNKLIACTTFPKMNVEKRVNRGLVMAEHRVSMQELTVLFASEAFAKDSKVYVRGDRITQPWAKEVFTFEDKEFILVPEAEVVFSKVTYNGPAFTYTSTQPGDSNIMLCAKPDTGDGGR